MPAHITISVSGIAPTADEADICQYFQDHLPGCQPVVGPLCHDVQTNTKVTTVTFKRKSKSACRKAVKKLEEDNDTMRDGDGVESTLGFSQSFLGLNLLECRSLEPTFE